MHDVLYLALLIPRSPENFSLADYLLLGLAAPKGLQN